MRKAVAVVVGLALAATGVLLLRAELMTVHVDSVVGSSTELIVSARTKEDPALRPEMTRGLVSTCRLLVNADVVEDSFREVAPAVFAFQLRPALDEFDRREMRGCLQDTRVQHLLVEVRRLDTVLPG